LAKNLSQFQSFVYASNFQIIGLSETWLSDNVTDLEILPQAYSLTPSTDGMKCWTKLKQAKQKGYLSRRVNMSLC